VRGHAIPEATGAHLRRTLIISRGDPLILLQRPISLTLLIMAAVLLALRAPPVPPNPLRRRLSLRRKTFHLVPEISRPIEPGPHPVVGWHCQECPTGAATRERNFAGKAGGTALGWSS
jgi:hypothetical protein